VEGLLPGLFEGYNAAVFAYGQTGAGKTFTMGSGVVGTNVLPETEGIVPRVVERIFQLVQQQEAEVVVVYLTWKFTTRK